MNYLSRLDLNKYRGKICLLRIDLNIKKGEEKNSFRLKVIEPTIKLLLKNKIKIVFLSHNGRPEKFDENFSLKIFTKEIERRVKKSVKFIDFYDLSVGSEIIKSSKNELFLLENLRFWVGEGKNDPKFARKLAILGDFYVNEAFAASHRDNASISAIKRFIPNFLGLWFEEELKYLTPFLRVKERPITIILGGEKISDKLGILRNFYKKADFFLLGGGPANTFIKADGLPIGDSIFDEKAMKLVSKYLKSEKIILPVDTKIKNKQILDVGSETVKKYSKIIKKSKIIIWSGPMGLYQKKGFENGTKGIWEAILANQKAKIVIGGGETVASRYLLKANKLPSNIFLSSGGGAMIKFLSGKKIAGMK